MFIYLIDVRWTQELMLWLVFRCDADAQHLDKLLSIESSSDWPASLHANTALTLHSQHMCESALRIADLTHNNTQNLPWLLRLSQITQSEQVSIGMCYYQVEGVKIMKRTTRSFSCFAELYWACYNIVYIIISCSIKCFTHQLCNYICVNFGEFSYFILVLLFNATDVVTGCYIGSHSYASYFSMSSHFQSIIRVLWCLVVVRLERLKIWT